MSLYHSHTYYEFIFVMSEGRIIFSNTGDSIESDGRCVCFHYSHVLHRNNVPGDVFYDRVVLYCGEAALSMIGGGEGVKHTAEECGFKSLSYFIQAFRQYTGQTPSAFSKKALGKFDYYT